MSAEPLPLPRALAWLALLVAPFLLNDFANIYVHAPASWLACDYGSRAVALASLACLLRCGGLAREDLRLRLDALWRLVIATLLATGVGCLLDSETAHRLVAWPTPWPTGFIPKITPPWLGELDYVGGLALVAVSEELVFRGALPALIVRAGGPRWTALVVSSALFGAAHWSLGAGQIVLTAFVGFSFGLAARFSRSLWPVMVAHYAVDLYAFG